MAEKIKSKRIFPWGKFSEFYVRPQGEGNALVNEFLRSRGKVSEEAETGITIKDVWMQVYRLNEHEIRELLLLARHRDPDSFRYFGKTKETENVKEFSYADFLDPGEREEFLANLRRRKSRRSRRVAAMTANHVSRGLE